MNIYRIKVVIETGEIKEYFECGASEFDALANARAFHGKNRKVLDDEIELDVENVRSMEQSFYERSQPPKPFVVEGLKFEWITDNMAGYKIVKEENTYREIVFQSYSMRETKEKWDEIKNSFEFLDELRAL